MNIRIGQGYDVHQLVEGRDLILGGVKIPFEKGLLGHSDADALLHAITDALLGAAGLGDIGSHFPDTAAEFKDADSRVLLREAYQSVQALGWRVVNVDTTIIAQKPKLAPHIPAMRANIAAGFGDSDDLRQHQRQNQRKTRLSGTHGSHRGSGGGVAGKSVSRQAQMA